MFERIIIKNKTKIEIGTIAAMKFSIRLSGIK